MFRFVHFFVKFLVRVLFAAPVVALIFYEKNEIWAFAQHYYDMARIPLENQFGASFPFREILAIALTLVLLFAWLPLPKRKGKKAITFPGAHGEVIIDLESNETTLQRIALKMPEVKNIAIDLEAGRKRSDVPVWVNASAVLVKGADEDARNVTARVEHHLKLHADRLLGLNGARVRLRVLRWRMSLKKIKPEPLLLEAPRQGEASHSETAVPVDPETLEDIPAAEVAR